MGMAKTTNKQNKKPQKQNIAFLLAWLSLLTSKPPGKSHDYLLISFFILFFLFLGGAMLYARSRAWDQIHATVATRAVVVTVLDP